MAYEDLNDHPHFALLQSESYVSPSEKAWLAWVERCERQLGHDLDGNNSDEAKANGTADGYSLDDAYAAWEAGATVDQYVAEVVAAKAERA